MINRRTISYTTGYYYYTILIRFFKKKVYTWGFVLVLSLSFVVLGVFF